MGKKSFANLQILQGLFTNKTFCLGVSVALAYATRVRVASFCIPHLEF